VWEFLGVHVDRPLPRLSMHADVGHFLQPPVGHLVEVVQRAELATAEQVRFDEIERPLHFAFGVSRQMHPIPAVRAKLSG